MKSACACTCRCTAPHTTARAAEPAMKSSAARAGPLQPVRVAMLMAMTIRELLRKHFPPKYIPPKPDLPRPLFTGTVDFITY